MVCFGNINSSQFNSSLAPLLLLLLRRQAH
jgi:hypothetical protein